MARRGTRSVGYYEGKQLLFASKLRAGFVPHTRREVFAKMQPLQSNVCPFANLPEKKRTQWALTREEMKDCIWLKPELVAQIKFASRRMSSAYSKRRPSTLIRHECCLIIQCEHSRYIGKLMFDSHETCRKVIAFLTRHSGKTIRIIEELELDER